MSTILHIIAAPASGGAEVFVRDLTCALARRGHVLHVVFIDRASDLGRDTEFEDIFLSHLNEHKVSYSFLGHEVRRKPWLGISRLRKIALDKGADLIHSHLAFGNIFACGVPYIPLIYTHHSERARFPKPYWLYFRRRVARFIGISETCANNLFTYAGSVSKVNTVLNGIDLDSITARVTRVSHLKDTVRAICVGRLSAQKNYPLLAQAIVELSSDLQSRISVDIFGEGDSSIISACENILYDGGVTKDAMRFCGVSSNIRKILSDYDIFLMSSDWEGLPVALIEATVAGLPAIVTKVGGCSEVVEAGPSGIVVPPSDAQAFSNAIALLINTPEIRERFSLNTMHTARVYSINEAVEAHLQIYREEIVL